MPSINISEADFVSVSSAARDAMARGKRSEAQALDKIARKINAALSGARVSGLMALAGSSSSRGPKWQDMPSTLDVPGV